MPGGGAIAVPIHAGDRVRLVDVEGMQRCEMVAADAAGVIDPAILGARGISDASGLKQILSGIAKARVPFAPGLSGVASISPAPAPSRCSAVTPGQETQANSPSRATAC